MFPTTFFSPWFFPPAYYAGGTLPSTNDPPPVVTYTDTDAFSAMSSALQATRAFAAVSYATSANPPSAAGQYPFASIQPTSWSEAQDSDGSGVLHRVSFNITLVVRDPLARNRNDFLNQLMAIVRTALNGSTLGGGCLPSQTQVLQGRLDPTAQPPEGRLVLGGQFAYRVAGT
jgi:hypothetical protein